MAPISIHTVAPGFALVNAAIIARLNCRAFAGLASLQGPLLLRQQGVVGPNPARFVDGRDFKAFSAYS